MPHQIVEYSANLEAKVDISALVTLMHETAAGIEAFPRAALRTRVARRDRYCIADRNPDNAFVYVLLRIASGRSPEVKKAAGDKLFEALCEFLAPVQATSPLGISFEIQEIDPVFRWKRNNTARGCKRGGRPRPDEQSRAQPPVRRQAAAPLPRVAAAAFHRWKAGARRIRRDILAGGGRGIPFVEEPARQRAQDGPAPDRGRPTSR